MVLPLIGAGAAVISELSFGTDGVIKAANAVAGASKSIGDSATSIKGAFDSAGDASDKVRSIFERNASATAGAFDKAGNAANPFAAANDRVALSLDRLNAATTETNTRLGAIADNTDRSFGRIAVQSAVAAAAMTVTRGIIIDSADAIKAATGHIFDFAISGVEMFALGVAGAGAALRNAVSGGLYSEVTRQTIEAAKAAEDFARTQGHAVSTLLAARDAAGAMGVSVETSRGFVANLTKAIEGTDAASEEARATARLLGVDLDGLSRSNAPEALQKLNAKLGEYRDGVGKTQIIQQLYGDSSVATLKAIANASEFTNEEKRRVLALDAELALREEQHAAALEALRSRPSWYDRLITNIGDALRLGEEFRAQLRLISQESDQAAEKFQAHGVFDRARDLLFGGNTGAGDELGRIGQANRDQLRAFGNKLFPSLIAPPTTREPAQETRPEAPDPAVFKRIAAINEVTAGYEHQLEILQLQADEADVLRAKEEARAKVLGIDAKATPEQIKAAEDAAAAAVEQRHLDRLQTSYDALASSLNPLVAAQAAFARGNDTIKDSLAAGLITTDEAAIATRNLEERYKDALDPLEAMRKKLAEERATLALGSQERRIANELLQRETELRQKGVEVTPRIIATLRGDIQGQIGAEATGRARDALDSGRDEIAVLQRSLELQGGNVELRGREVAALQERLRIEREFPSLDDKVKQDLIAQAALRGELNAKIKENDEAERDFKQIARQGVSDLAHGFEDAIFSGKKLTDVLQSVGQALVKLAFRASIEQPLTRYIDSQIGSAGAGGLFNGAGALGGLFSGYGLGGTGLGAGLLASSSGATGASFAEELAAGVIALHDGGTVGVHGAPRAMPRAAFRDAPRFHDGVYLAPDERMAILQTGEQVRSRAQVANDRATSSRSGAAVVNNFNFAAGTDRNISRQTMNQLSASALSGLARASRR